MIIFYRNNWSIYVKNSFHVSQISYFWVSLLLIHENFILQKENEGATLLTIYSILCEYVSVIWLDILSFSKFFVRSFNHFSGHTNLSLLSLIIFNCRNNTSLSSPQPRIWGLRSATAWMPQSNGFSKSCFKQICHRFKWLLWVAPGGE